MTSIEPPQPGVWSQPEVKPDTTFEHAAKNHAIETVLLGNRPRHTRMKPRKEDPFVKFFVGYPSMFWAAYDLFHLVIAIVVVLFGQTVVGRVVTKEVTSSNTPTYTIGYSYVVGRQRFYDKNEVYSNDYNALKTRDAVPVRILKRLPNSNSQIVFPSESLWTYAGSLVFETVFINIIGGAFAWRLYIAPWRQRRLIANGLPTVARITEVREVKNKGVTYELKYEYAPDEYVKGLVGNVFRVMPRTQEHGQMRQAYTTVSQKDGQAIHVGDTLTVLFDPNKPQRHILYRCADYKVI